MKLILKSLLIILFTYLFQKFLPWWSIAAAAFLINVILHTKAYSSFASGFLGIAVLWFIVALILDQNTNSILTKKIAQLFMLNEPILLVFVTSILGGIVGGFSGLTGSFFRSMLKKKRKDYYYS